MKKRDAIRLGIAAVDEAIGRAREAGERVEDLNLLRAALSSGLLPTIESRLAHIRDKSAIDAVEKLLAAMR